MNPDLMKPRLVSPLVDVVLDDGAILRVQTANPDQIKYEKTAQTHRWPKMQDQPAVWLTFIAWHALRREGQIPKDLTWETFSESRCLHVLHVETETDQDGDEGEVGPGLPTPPGPDPG